MFIGSGFSYLTVCIYATIILLIICYFSFLSHSLQNTISQLILNFINNGLRFYWFIRLILPGNGEESCLCLIHTLLTFIFGGSAALLKCRSTFHTPSAATRINIKSWKPFHFKYQNMIHRKNKLKVKKLLAKVLSSFD